jgi:hypothetical protein
MIVALDSTVLVSDPLLGSTAWKILAHASRQWDVRLCTTELVLLEAAAGYRRRMAEATVGFERWEARHAGALGLQSLAAEVRNRLSELEAAYATKLRGVLDDIPVEVLPIPDVSHRVLVERATNRIPPCDEAGDGYRDTLNWFSLLAVAQDDEDGVFWVSGDADFAGPDGSDLHPVLQDELREQGLRQVRLARSLHDAALGIAGHFAQVTEEDLQQIQARLATDTLTTFVRTELLADLPAVDVSVIPLALPVGARSPVFGALHDITESNFEVKSQLEGGGAAVEVAFVCAATILVEAAPDTDLGTEFAEVSEDDDIRVWQTTKPICFKALLTVDQYDRPTGGELTSIRARDDDPGHAAWRRAMHRRIAKAGGLSPETMEAFREMQGFKFPPETMEAFREMQGFKFPPETMEAFRKIQGFKFPPETMEAFRKIQGLSIPTETFEALRRAQASSTANDEPQAGEEAAENPDDSGEGGADESEDPAD